MNNSEYLSALKEKCQSENKSQTYTNQVIEYAQALLSKNLPVIFDPIHFSMLVGYRLDLLYAISNSQESFYRTFYIKKRSGKLRKISEPLPMLKEIQRFILDNILYRCKASRFSKAFIPKCSIKENARFHRSQKVVLKIDIKDYFPSISEHNVFTYLSTLGYNRELTILLTKICVLNHALPQGAPTSPYLSNLITQHMDDIIFSLCSSYNPPLRYTRYADDITISGCFYPRLLIKKVCQIIYSVGLKPNYSKICVVYSNKSQKVTGVVVNQVLQAPKEYRKEIRKTMYYINKNGVEDHLQHINNSADSISYLRSLLGKINYCLSLNPSDDEMKTYKLKAHDYLQARLKN